MANPIKNVMKSFMILYTNSIRDGKDDYNSNS